jgi:hypothetical protein
MPLKKLLYILLSVWLINALVCFQGSNVFDNGNRQIYHQATPRHIPNTLIRALRNSGREVEDNDDNTTEKISHNLRYFGRSSQIIDVYWTSIQRTNNASNVAGKLSVQTFFRSVNSRWLPSPEVPIFRLTPF